MNVNPDNQYQPHYLTHHHQPLSPAAAAAGYNIYDNNFDVEHNIERNHNNRITYNNNNSNNVKNKETNTDYHDNKYFDIHRKHR